MVKMENLKHYIALAEIFKYPTTGGNIFISEWRKIIKNKVPEMAPKLRAFTDHIQNKTISARQEYYIATFDVQASCYLDVGYVLYGEDYNRGIFLMNMKKEQEKAGNDYGKELPDHLPAILSLLPKLEDESFAEELLVSMLIPALEKMIESFLAKNNVYKGMLETLQKIMENDFPHSEYERFNFNSQEKAKSFECFPQWMNIK